MLKKLVFTLCLTFGITVLLIAQGNKPIRTYTLDNGLTVMLLEDHQLPKVVGMVVTKAGGKNDPAEATGMAHYMEHMLFKGTEQIGTTDWLKEKPWIDTIFGLYDKLGQTTDAAERAKIQVRINNASVKANEYVIPNELSNIIKESGGTGLNAGTGPDQTVYYNAFPPSEMNKWLEIYSQRFINPVFRSFQAELEVVYEEKNMYADNFGSNLIEKFQKNFFKVHPYGQQPLIGTLEHLKNPSLTKMSEFFHTWYVANNMGLLLIGDFSSDEIMPLIREKFGRLPQQAVPAPKVFAEVPFKGREEVTLKLSPVKIGVLGFRTPPKGHPDEFALKITAALFNNQNNTGLLDKLAVDGKLLTASALQFPYNDLGAYAFLFVPKIIGQSLESAEALVLSQVDKLCKGEVEDWMFEAAKLSLYREQLLSLESASGIGMEIIEAFTQGRDPNEIYTYSDRIAAITKADVVAVANKYFGKDYLAFYSKMGFPKAAKIDKPPYTPIVSKNEKKSDYAAKLLAMPSGQMRTKFIGFGTDCQMADLADGNKLYYTANPLNGIFNLTINYTLDANWKRSLPLVSEIMSFAGTTRLPGNKFREEFDKIGCSLSFNDDNKFFSISVQGVEENLGKALSLVDELLRDAVVDKSKMAVIIDGVKAERKIEKTTPDGMAAALFEYVNYGKQSAYLDRLSMKELKSTSSDSLLAQFKRITAHKAVVFYVGRIAREEIRASLDKALFAGRTLKPMFPVQMRAVVGYNENTVYFANLKKANQAKVFFYKKGPAYLTSDNVGLTAFNLYFGGDFSGLVLQEIREYRSFAYTAGAMIQKPFFPGDPLVFYGFVGTQADKTNEAIGVFNGLVADMPAKKDRTEMIRKFQSFSLATSTPAFREIPSTVFNWELKGYQSDPTQAQIKQLENLSFEEINKVYLTVVKPGPMVISIAGNKKRIDFKDLEKYGTIKKVKPEMIFRD